MDKINKMNKIRNKLEQIYQIMIWGWLGVSIAWIVMMVINNKIDWLNFIMGGLIGFNLFGIVLDIIQKRYDTKTPDDGDCFLKLEGEQMLAILKVCKKYNLSVWFMLNMFQTLCRLNADSVVEHIAEDIMKDPKQVHRVRESFGEYEEQFDDYIEKIEEAELEKKRKENDKDDTKENL